MEITCISCPIGCRIQLEIENDKITKLTGNACSRGVKYANQEAIAPQRMLTAVIKLENSALPLSVKTSDAIPKELIFKAMHEINAVKINTPIKIGDVIIKNILNTNVDIIATKSIG